MLLLRRYLHVHPIDRVNEEKMNKIKHFLKELDSLVNSFEVGKSFEQKNNSLTFENLVATDGFYFSGSSLINDIFKECGYIVPENVRADELLYTL